MADLRPPPHYPHIQAGNPVCLLGRGSPPADFVFRMRSWPRYRRAMAVRAPGDLPTPRFAVGHCRVTGHCRACQHMRGMGMPVDFDVPGFLRPVARHDALRPMAHPVVRPRLPTKSEIAASHRLACRVSAKWRPHPGAGHRANPAKSRAGRLERPWPVGVSAAGCVHRHPASPQPVFRQSPKWKITCPAP